MSGAGVTPRAAPAAAGTRLAWFAIAVVIGHHVGTIFKPLGTVGPTEWADWIDLLVPLAVLGTAALVLDRVRSGRRDWLVYAAGALAYTQGQAVHLAANSVSNAGPTGRALDAAHLWDEVVSHYVWYAGLAVVVVALVRVLLPTGVRAAPLAWPLAVLYGVTATTNSIEGGTPVLGLVVAAGFTGWGWARRAHPAGRLLLAAYGASLLLLAGWGAWHGGFPQFSELGWI